ncbi:cytochrome c3 family protein [Lutimonas zeaxanthinifaciens]|uniref:cytochrome c3 family protein n=1 Tax=Lutimonas zeaxanthinifaciens TaxID=3060215 RepID=UPI00265D42FC|nr:cytochrome c3 family protein [Lutimonas sp. YSD2104]WKK67277.1 cytochrome c3 family protein [Lutimonas sp. YSD2104]
MKAKQIFLTLSLVMASLCIYSQTGITNSAHDFSGETWTTNGEICVTCHTPHNSTIVANSPLWDHELSSFDFTGNLYTSTTLDATDMANPTGVSRLCLSCHDGTVALDNFGGNTTGTANISSYADKGVGTSGSLAAEHPVSFTYDAGLATSDPGLYNPTVQTSGIAGGTTIEADMLFASRVECASCHDVHNSAGNPMLLIKSNTGSALCMTCHNK